ncbi:MAG: hypothetical protein EWV53_04660 [Microcystis panniformis Mp_MB_F_20051200_S9]|uniref:Uncharacterized protein n=1 Tax=Microcystis panniformis Mp_MB_F_20051200_S9 TaxID=2486223 RepID=A0A552Q7S8_9CHRO|nr:MAG: hypothetical protein EWV87_17795 [Microcystis panniformis Mp_GB_SS_20050300_S99]TRV50674.1 MAG: hypothetical protein EWV43_05780 [Microcystis panniformis Mp_MB_F_20080800_S26D]TRV55232.1 MAG: hypothetical protein EWV42_01960 [Microcystis panniformis Mp_GB_SS_20050300_S99D]TRV58228.1 MAG: hypothetical protein EWV69_14315 [Microcystis panniformis Mp_MB_F_20080800_S26]TRV65285.1 MAG: hypothetical protein EWV53_04660 [Microcystis panniformis Mp_MB_F_20051200_S9]TRV67201.1 MAG: hypothetical
MERTLQNRHSLLLLPKKRSLLAFLSQAMTILKFNQQDHSDRTTRSASVIDVRRNSFNSC